MDKISKNMVIIKFNLFEKNFKNRIEENMKGMIVHYDPICFTKFNFYKIFL